MMFLLMPDWHWTCDKVRYGDSSTVMWDAEWAQPWAYNGIDGSERHRAMFGDTPRRDWSFGRLIPNGEYYAP